MTTRKICYFIKTYGNGKVEMNITDDMSIIKIEEASENDSVHYINHIRINLVDSKIDIKIPKL